MTRNNLGELLEEDLKIERTITWICRIRARELVQELQEFKENYGKKDASAILSIKNIYKELFLEETYKKFERNSYRKILSKIRSLGNELVPEKSLIYILNKIYKRTK